MQEEFPCETDLGNVLGCQVCLFYFYHCKLWHSVDTIVYLLCHYIPIDDAIGVLVIRQCLYRYFIIEKLKIFVDGAEC